MISFQSSSGDSKLQQDFGTFISPQSFMLNWLTVRGQKDVEVGLVLGLEFIVSNQGTSVCYRCNLGGNQEMQALFQCPPQCWGLPEGLPTSSPMEPGPLVWGLNLASCWFKTPNKKSCSLPRCILWSCWCSQKWKLLPSLNALPFRDFSVWTCLRSDISPHEKGAAFSSFIYQIYLGLLHLDNSSSRLSRSASQQSFHLSGSLYRQPAQAEWNHFGDCHRVCESLLQRNTHWLWALVSSRGPTCNKKLCY